MGTSHNPQSSEETFDAASIYADMHDMRFTNPSSGCYQLRHNKKGWIINMYPRRKGLSPRMYHDAHRPGPFLTLPKNWSLMDAVMIAVKTERELEHAEPTTNEKE